MDVKSLCSSIPHSDGIKACEVYVIENGFTSMEISIITKIIYFTLTHNYFEFNDKSYSQTDGTAMGKKMAPTYANIFMWNFEKYLLDYCTDKPFYIYVIYMTFLLYGNTVKTNLNNFMHM